jgi:hypothetical protein
MFRAMRLAWSRAKALSILQNAYDMPLRHPLDSLADADLRATTAIAIDTGGNEFDAAAAFMTHRIKCGLEAELKLGPALPLKHPHWHDLPKCAVGFARTGPMMKFHRQHMDALSEINMLKAEVEAKRAGRIGSSANPASTHEPKVETST